MYIDFIALFVLFVIYLICTKEWTALLCVLAGLLVILALLFCVHFIGATWMFIIVALMSVIYFISVW